MVFALISHMRDKCNMLKIYFQQEPASLLCFSMLPFVILFVAHDFVVHVCSVKLVIINGLICSCFHSCTLHFLNDVDSSTKKNPEDKMKLICTKLCTWIKCLLLVL